MIPVLICPVLNHNDLLDKMLRSIDHPVKLLYVIDNGGGVPRNMEYAHLPNIFVADTGHNHGVAGSWNLGIRANIEEPYWLFVNNDLEFEPGALARLVETIEQDNEPHLVMIEMGNENWGNHYGAFAVNAAAVDMVGWFDENLHPIYFEDTDHKRRAERLGLRMTVVPSTTQHVGNQSWAGDEDFSKANKISWDYNVKYFDAKWNNPEPWDMTKWPQPSVERLRATAWKNVRTRESDVK